MKDDLMSGWCYGHWARVGSELHLAPDEGGLTILHPEEWVPGPVVNLVPNEPRARGTWECRNGSVIEIRTMTDDHLYNTIQMCRRQLRQTRDPFTGITGGFEGRRAEEWADLKAEADRRGLDY